MDVITFIIKFYQKIEFFPNVVTKTPSSSKLKSFLRIFIFIWFFVIYDILLMINAIVKENFTDSLFLLASAVEIAVLTVRILALARNKNDIMFLIKEMSKHSIEREECYQEVVRKNEKFRKFIYCLGFMNLFAMISVVALPVVSSEKKLVFEIWLPFEYHCCDYIFWMVYAYATTCIFFAILSVSAVIIVWYLFFNGVVMYEILGNNLKRLGHFDRGNDLMQKYKRYQRVEELKTLIMGHRSINRYFLYSYYNIVKNKIFFFLTPQSC